MTRVLVLNAGSATLKATVLDLPATAPVVDTPVDWPPADRDAASSAALRRALESVEAAGVAASSIEVVGHRVVHGGERFVRPCPIDDAVVDALEGLTHLAPLHGPPAVAGIRAARAALPDVPHVAAFDTAFHADLPDAARRYPVPDAWSVGHGIRRYGFHGLSVAWSVGRSAELLGRDATDLRLLVAHLGGGCSVTAVDRGRSVATSMGMTPLEGMMMATRAGSIDPGIVFALARAGVPLGAVERDLEHGSGLLGVGGSGDMRTLLDRATGPEDDPDAARARLAIDLFATRAAAEIAGAATALPEVDALAFTGGIGTHATAIRLRIEARLAPMGITEEGDGAAGDAPGSDAVVCRPDGRPAVLRILAREDVVIARAAVEVTSGSA